MSDKTDVVVGNGNLLGKDQILGAQDILFEEVKVPEWGGTVRIKALNGEERDAFEQSMIEQNGDDQRVNMRNARAKLCALSIVDDKGTRIFRAADIEHLGKKSASALARVYNKAQKLSGFSKEDVEELAGNSKAVLSDAF